MRSSRWGTEMDEMDERWLGCLFYGVSALVILGAFHDQLSQHVQLVLVVFGCVVIGAGVVLAPDKLEP